MNRIDISAKLLSKWSTYPTHHGMVLYCISSTSTGSYPISARLSCQPVYLELPQIWQTSQCTVRIYRLSVCQDRRKNCYQYNTRVSEAVANGTMYSHIIVCDGGWDRTVPKNACRGTIHHQVNSHQTVYGSSQLLNLPMYLPSFRGFPTRSYQPKLN